jgi:pimeloyl-ACP methyl ester carboxylesterase
MEYRKFISLEYKNNIYDISYLDNLCQAVPLIYVHGLGCAGIHFSGAFSHPILNKYRLLALDFPGHGDSAYHENCPFTVDDLVAVLLKFIDQLALPPGIMVAHSMGGLTALLFSKRFPNRIRGLINVEGNLAGEDCFLSRKVIKRSREQWQQRFFPATVKNLKLSENRGFREFADWFAKSSAAAIYDLSSSIVDYSDHGGLLTIVTALPIPVWYLYGADNRHLPYLEYLRLKAVKVKEIPHSGHFPFYDNPKDFFNEIGTIVSEICPLPGKPTEKKKC